MKTIPLYEVPKKSPLRIELKNGSVDLATFHHIDGMYSYCTTSDGKPFHLSASTPMKMVAKRYEIQYPKAPKKSKTHESDEDDDETLSACCGAPINQQELCSDCKEHA